jgi:hypothetical protein
MKKLIVIITGILVIFAIVVVILIIKPSQKLSQEQKEYNDLIQDLINKQQIEKVEILYIPWYVESPVEFDIETIKQNYTYSIVLFKKVDNKQIQSLLKAVKNERVFKLTDHSCHLNWGCVFYDKHEKPILEIFINSWGTEGYIQDKQITIKGSIYKWLKKNSGELYSRCDPWQKYVEPDMKKILKRAVDLHSVYESK